MKGCVGLYSSPNSTDNFSCKHRGSSKGSLWQTTMDHKAYLNFLYIPGEFRPCSVPGCRFDVGFHTKPNQGFATRCLEHNRCRFCGYPSQWAPDICGLCDGGEALDLRGPCAFDGCTLRVVHLASPCGSMSRYCFAHNRCHVCKKEHNYSEDICGDCPRDALANKRKPGE
jgi:hypothetical protein